MLMANKDQKKLSTVIYSSMNDKGTEERQEAPVVDGALQDDSVAVDACAEDLMSALAVKDPKAVVAALKDLLYLLQEPESTEASEA